MARIYRELPVGETLKIELKEGQFLPGRVAWARDWYVGLTFDEAIDVEEALASRWISECGQRPRLPRIEVECPARVRIGSRFYAGTLRNISQGGAKVEIARSLEAWGDASLRVADLPPFASQIRWMFGDCLGLSFNERLPFEVLALWLHNQRTGDAPQP
jgi:hypothetical protein